MEARKKTEYLVRNVKLVPASQLWPHREDTEGVFVLVGEYRYDREGTEWVSLRSSKVLGFDLETGTYETMNSMYRIVVSQDNIDMSRNFELRQLAHEIFHGQAVSMKEVDLTPYEETRYRQYLDAYRVDMMAQRQRDYCLQAQGHPTGFQQQAPQPLFANQNPAP